MAVFILEMHTYPVIRVTLSWSLKVALRVRMSLAYTLICLCGCVCIATLFLPSKILISQILPCMLLLVTCLDTVSVLVGSCCAR